MIVYLKCPCSGSDAQTPSLCNVSSARCGAATSRKGHSAYGSRKEVSESTQTARQGPPLGPCDLSFSELWSSSCTAAPCYPSLVPASPVCVVGHACCRGEPSTSRGPPRLAAASGQHLASPSGTPPGRPGRPEPPEERELVLRQNPIDSISMCVSPTSATQLNVPNSGCQQASSPTTGTASRSCSCSWPRCRSTAGSSSCGT